MSRLDELQAELAKVFGRLSKWRARCAGQSVGTEAEQIAIAEQVLAEPCSGTVAEAQSHWLETQGVQPIDLEDFLGRSTGAASSSSRGKP